MASFSFTVVFHVGVFLALCSSTLQPWPWHHHESDQQQEQVSQLTDEDIDEGLQNEDDPLIKYTFVVIAFDRALRLRLRENLLHSITQICAKSHFKNDFVQDFRVLVQCATRLTIEYSERFLNTQSFSKIAYYYRLLMWIKYHMRYHNEMLNAHLEAEINNVFELIGKTDLNILRDIVPGHHLNDRILYINTMQALKDFGNVKDRIMGFCIKLADNDGAAAKDTAHVTMPFQDQVELYENFILETSSLEHYFVEYLEKSGIEILVYVYEASLRRRDDVKYQRINGHDIILNRNDSSKIPMRYFRDIIVIYGQSLEKIPLLQIDDQIILDNMLRLENIPVDEHHGEKLEMGIMRFDVICTLVTHIINDYEEEIKKREELKTFTLNSKICYCRIVYWTRKKLTTSAVLPKIRHALDNIYRARKSDCRWQGLPEDDYIDKATLDEVLDICTPESIVQIINAKNQDDV